MSRIDSPPFGLTARKVYAGDVGVSRALRKAVSVVDFATAAQWSPLSGTDTIAADNTNVRMGIYSAGIVARSMKFTKVVNGASASFTRDYGAASGLDLAGHLLASFYVHDDGHAHKLTAIQLLISDPAGFGAYASFGLVGAGTQYSVPAGWHEVVVTPSVATLVGVPNLASVRYVRVTAFTTGDNAATPSITFAAVRKVPTPSKAYYAMTFDDGSADHFNLACYLASRGIPATFYVVGNLIGTAGHLTLDQLWHMKEMGHLIASHTWDHLYPVSSTNPPVLQESEAKTIDSICRMTEWLSDNGFAEGARILALPGGYTNWREDTLGTPYSKLFLGRYAEQVRLAGTSYTQGLANPRRLAASAFDSAANAATALTRVKSDKGACITGWHASGTNYTVADWKTHVDAVVTDRDAGNIEVVTMRDLLGISS